MAFETFLAYEASAGSGKTFMLVVRYLSLLFMGKEPSKILALTFTNKAANEMQERIVSTLETLHEREDGELKEISRVIEQPAHEILAQRDAILKRLLQSDTKVMTIDKFLAIILRKFSLHAGIMPTFSTHESQHDIKVLTRFLQELFSAKQEDSLINLTLINSAQLSETIGLLNRLYMLQNNSHKQRYAPCAYLHVKEEILAEVEQLRALVYSHESASSTAKKSMDIESFEALLKKSWYVKETLNYSTYKKCFTPQMDLHLKTIQQKLQEYYTLKEQNYFYELLSLVDTYEKSKLFVAKEESELGFDDVTALVHKMLTSETLSREFLYFRLDASIDHLLLDEFQDTSMIQFEILAPIISEICSGVGVSDEKSLFFVGDVKQSIYRFRGGTKELFYEVAQRFNVNVEVLGTNYRSSKAVVDFVNAIFEPKMKGYKPQQVKEGAARGCVEVVEDDDLLEATLLHVKELLKQGVENNSIAILCATNSDGVTIKEALHAEGIDVITETTSKLINQQEIQALIQYLKYLYFKEEIYAQDFFSLINHKPEPLECVAGNSMELVASVKGIIEKYGLFSGDLNSIRFLELLYNSSDIEAFIYEYERLESAAVEKEQMGVRVLTVHKSKGLEFDHVIVLDRFTRARPNNDRLIFEYDGVVLQNIFLRQKGRDALDNAYSNALAKDAKLADEDKLNALYVAFTRAKETLYIVKKTKASQFESLDLNVSKVGHLHVNPAAPKEAKKSADVTYAPLHLGRQEVLLKSENEEEQNLHAIDFGLALHYALEMCDLQDSSSLDGVMQSIKNRFSLRLGDDDFYSIKERVSRLLNHAAFHELIDGVCHKEQPISFAKELRYIDLMVEREHDVVIIDYKSSQLYRTKHHQQVDFYKSAVKNILNTEVTAYLIYLLEDGIELVSV